MCEILRDSSKRSKNPSIWNHEAFRCNLQVDDLKMPKQVSKPAWILSKARYLVHIGHREHLR